MIECTLEYDVIMNMSTQLMDLVEWPTGLSSGLSKG